MISAEDFAWPMIANIVKNTLRDVIQKTQSTRTKRTLLYTTIRMPDQMDGTSLDQVQMDPKNCKVYQRQFDETWPYMPTVIYQETLNSVEDWTKTIVCAVHVTNIEGLLDKVAKLTLENSRTKHKLDHEGRIYAKQQASLFFLLNVQDLLEAMEQNHPVMVSDAEDDGAPFLYQASFFDRWEAALKLYETSEEQVNKLIILMQEHFHSLGIRKKEWKNFVLSVQDLDSAAPSMFPQLVDAKLIEGPKSSPQAIRKWLQRDMDCGQRTYHDINKVYSPADMIMLFDKTPKVDAKEEEKDEVNIAKAFFLVRYNKTDEALMISLAYASDTIQENKELMEQCIAYLEWTAKLYRAKFIWVMRTPNEDFMKRDLYGKILVKHFPSTTHPWKLLEKKL